MRSLAARSPRSTRRASSSSSAGVSSGVLPMSAMKAENPSAMSVIPSKSARDLKPAPRELKGSSTAPPGLSGADAAPRTLRP